ncbi:hypothetical protein GCM10023089_03110 [Quisquiliibacterium transsilvanicum]
MASFQPHTDPRPCRYCHWLLALEEHAGTALCGRGGRVTRHWPPAGGCTFWEREPGSDDDLQAPRACESAHYVPATKLPDFPPCFSSTRTSSITMPRSAAFSMS